MKNDLPSVGDPTAEQSKPEQAAVAVAEPPAKTKSKAKSVKAKPAAGDLVAELSARQADLLQAGEMLCQRLAANEDVSESDRLVFVALGWDKEKIKHETARIASVIRWQNQAGTSAEFEAAKIRHAALSQSVPSEVAKLRDEVAKLQSQIAAKENTLQQSAKNVEGMQAARKTLREMVPQHVRDSYNRQRTKIGQAERAIEMRQVESRVAMIQNVLQNLERPASHEAELKVVLHCESARPDLLTIQKRGGPNGNTMIVKTVAPVAWKSYCDSLRAELPGLETLVADTKAKLDAQHAALEAMMLDVYLVR